MSGRSPNYRLKTEHKGLEVGSFIRPIELQWVSNEMIDDIGFDAKFIEESISVVCYTKLGMMVIPRNKIEEI